MTIEIETFFHKPTWTYSYLVYCPNTRAAAVIDSALEFDPASGRTGTETVEIIAAAIEELKLDLKWVLETHAHADHLSAAPFLKDRFGAQVAIGEGIRQVQSNFKTMLNLGDELATDGSQFDHLVKDGDTLPLGDLEIRVLGTPGHTDDSVTYIVADAAFVGDSIFMPDMGTARCDFPGGDAGKLYDSIQRLFELPPETRLFMCHDYAPGGRELENETTVAEEMANNKHVGGGATREAFIEMRTTRDAELDMPRLIFPSVQVNIRAGRLPEPESNGARYLKLPLDAV
jgi:glyoxylase-like metal-dependent hydrolase (beta-lactamase superfamily II)